MRLPSPPWVVAHRGASGDRLENTIGACRLAVEQGAPMLEIDVQLASDGELVVFHDWDLARLGAGDPRVVERLPSQALVGVELALVRDGGPSLGGRMPTLRELLAALPAGLPLDVEVKRREADRDLVATALMDLLGDRANVVVSSFDWEQLAVLRRIAPQIAVAPLASRPPVEEVLAVAERLASWSIHVHARLVSPALVDAARKAGRPVLAYTVNEVADARALFAAGVSGVFTDHPARMLRALEAAC